MVVVDSTVEVEFDDVVDVVGNCASGGGSSKTLLSSLVDVC